MRNLGRLVVLLVAAQAAAAPPRAPVPRPAVSLRADLDGDGVLESCVLRFDGTFVVRSGQSPAPRYERLIRGGVPARAVLRTHRVRGPAGPVTLVELRVPLTTPGAEEVVALRGRPFGEIFAGRVGPMGRDAEWSRHLEITPDGVRLFERVPSVTRCDGAPTFLHPRVYDPAAGRFQPAPAPPPAAARFVAASRRPPAGAPAGAPLARFFVSGASSVAGDGGHAAALTPPSSLTDGNPATAWVTGEAATTRGLFATVRGAPGPYRVRAIRIVPGHGKSLPAYRYYQRLRRGVLALGRGHTVGVELPRELAGDRGFGAAYWVVLPEPVATPCVTLVVDATYPGTATGPASRLAIAELTVYTDADFGLGLERLVGDLASGAGDGTTVRLVAAQGARAEAPLLAALPRATERGRTLVVEALAQVATAAAAPALVRALAGDAHAARAAAQALRRMGPAAAPALMTALGDFTAPATLRAQVATQLARLGGEENLRAVFAALPGAPPRLRAGLVAALRAGDPRLVLRLASRGLAAAAAPEHRADLLRLVASAAAGAEPADRARAAAAVVAAAPAATSFAERFRLARAAGALGDARLAPIVDTLLGAREPELREAAATAAGELPAAQAAPALARALRDASPEVRRAAAEAVGRRRTVTGAPLAAVAALLGGDRWPFVRLEAATALGARCGDPAGIAALHHAATTDPDREVARAALRGVVACRDPRAAEVLLTILRDGRRPALLRETAAAGFGALGDRNAVPALARLLDELRTEPGTDDAGEALVVTLARTLGRLGDERALRALRQASVDPASATLRATAYEAIAAICPVGATAVLREGERDKDPRVVRAARAARARCRR